MTDYRSLEQLDVFRADERVGVLRRLPRGCEFRYREDFLRSAEPPIALHLPKTPEALITEGVLNLPPFFAGLLPEGVMFAAAQRLIGSAKDDLFAVLAATGRDAVGDVDVREPGAATLHQSGFNIESAKEAIDLILDSAGGGSMPSRQSLEFSRRCRSAASFERAEELDTSPNSRRASFQGSRQMSSRA